MLKQTTIAGADDSLSSLENRNDFQTDGCMHSLSSPYLEKEFRTLSLHDPKAGTGVFSCESGIASCNKNYSVQTVTIEDSELKLQNQNSVRDGQYQTLSVNGSLTDDTDTKRSSTVAEVYVDGKDLRKKNQDRNRECWDEMCEAFPDQDGDT